jgi:hypothetical protein
MGAGAQLNLHKYASQKKLTDGQNRISLFIDIQMELLQPYGDLRLKARRPLTEKEEFLALTGESERSLVPGKLVTATTVYVGRDFARLRLDNGLDGRLTLEGVKSYPPDRMDRAQGRGARRLPTYSCCYVSVAVGG